MLAATGVAALALSGCGAGGTGSASGAPTLTWYTNPDNGGQAALAAKCTAAADGAYRITTAQLPRDASDQREQLVRRLAAGDSSIDLMSLDPPFLPEFAQAGFLYDLPAEREADFAEGIVEPAVESATWQDELVAVPFWANTQLLWYRASVAQEAGLDMSGPVTWQQVVDAAERTGTTVGVQANRYEGYTVWINALVESAGGSILQNPGAGPEQLDLGLASPAGRTATSVIGMVADSPASGPALSTADEEAARALFEGPSGGFMVNWPYVYAAASAAVEDGTLDPAVLQDIRWTSYPSVAPGVASTPPLGGIALGVGAFSEHPQSALDAAECITSEESQKAYMLSDGNPATAEDVYDDPEVLEQYPMAPAIRDALRRAAPRPQSPYYTEISESLQRVYHPPASVDPRTTPQRAEELIRAVLAKEALL